MSKPASYRLTVFIHCVAFVFLSFANAIAQSQITQPFRFEEEQKVTDRNYNIISMQKEGLALVRDNEKFENGKKVWELTILDSTLQKKTSQNLELSSKTHFIGYEYIPGSLYLLFRNGEVNSNDMHLLHYSLGTGETTLHEIKHDFELRLTHFSIAGANAVFGGYLSREPAVLLYSLEDKQVKVVPGFFLHDTELLDLRVNHNNTFNVLMVERGSKDIKKLVVRTFDQVGTQLLDDIIVIDKDITLLSGITSTLIRDELMVIGTYSNGINKMSNGFYAVPVDPFSEQIIHYTDFTKLNHFLDFMGDSKSLKVKENAEKQRQKGKAPSFRSNIALIRIQETTKGFLLLAETYNATSTSVNPYPYNSYSSPYGFNSPYSGPYFNNRQYNSPYSYANNQPSSDVKMMEGVLVLFEDDGELAWDESFALNDLRLPGLEQASDFTETNKGIVIAFKNKSDIFSKYMPKEGVSALDTTQLKLRSELDKIKNEEEHDGGLRYWYNNNFYVWGYQSIKSKGTDDPNRHVFYINKMGVE